MSKTMKDISGEVDSPKSPDTPIKERVIFRKKDTIKHPQQKKKKSPSKFRMKLLELRSDNENLSRACVSLVALRDDLTSKLDAQAQKNENQEEEISKLKKEVSILQADKFLQKKYHSEIESKYRLSIERFKILVKKYKLIEMNYREFLKVQNPGFENKHLKNAKQQKKKRSSLIKGIFGFDSTQEPSEFENVMKFDPVVERLGENNDAGGVKGLFNSSQESFSSSIFGGEENLFNLESTNLLEFESIYPFKRLDRWDDNDLLNFLRDAGLFNSYFHKFKEFNINSLQVLSTLLPVPPSPLPKSISSGDFLDDDEDDSPSSNPSSLNMSFSQGFEINRNEFFFTISDIEIKLLSLNIFYFQQLMKNPDEDIYSPNLPKLFRKLSYLDDFLDPSNTFSSLLKLSMNIISKNKLFQSLFEFLRKDKTNTIPVHLIILSENSFHDALKLDEIPLFEVDYIFNKPNFVNSSSSSPPSSSSTLKKKNVDEEIEGEGEEEDSCSSSDKSSPKKKENSSNSFSSPPASSSDTPRIQNLIHPPFTVGLVIGQWILSFGSEKSRGLVIPRKINVYDEKAIERIREYGIFVKIGIITVQKLRDNIDKLIDSLIRFNCELNYNRTECNSQHFLDFICCEKVLQLTLTKTLSSPILEFLKFIKSNCYQKIEENDSLFLITPIFQWSNEQVINWSKKYLKLPKFFDSFFFENKVSGRDLLEKFSQPLKDSTSVLLGEKLRSEFSNVDENKIQVKKLKVFLLHFKSYHGKVKKPLTFSKGMNLVVEKIMTRPDDSLQMGVSQIQKHSVILSNGNFLAKMYLPVKEDLIEDILKSKCLKIKMIITEIAHRTQRLNEIMNQIISRILTRVRYFGDSDFGLFHSAILIGNWYLEWTDTQLVIPKKLLQSGGAFFLLDLPPISFSSCGDDRKKIRKKLIEIRKKVVKILIKWNTTVTYHRTKSNCQTFVDDVLKELGLSREIKKNSCVGKYVSDIRKKGTAAIYFEPNEKFLNYFLNNEERDKENMEKEKEDDTNKKKKKSMIFSKKTVKKGMKKGKIVFSSHSDLDEYVHNLCLFFKSKKLLEFSTVFEDEYNLLKSFDRAFWLRFQKFPKSSKYKPSNKNMIYGATGFRCGCPFHSPFESLTFQGNSQLNIQRLREEEEKKWKPKMQSSDL